MNKKFPYADPATIEKKRALEFMALSFEDKYKRLMQMIKISYEIRQSNKDNTSTTKRDLS